jgi:hypothetical protein
MKKKFNTEGRCFPKKHFMENGKVYLQWERNPSRLGLKGTVCV